MLKKVILTVFMIVSGMQAAVEQSKLLGSDDVKEPDIKPYVYMEVASPQPKYVKTEESTQERWLKEDFKQDQDRGFKNFTIPSEVQLDLGDFQKDVEQGSEKGPFIRFQFRKRVFKKKKKIYEVERSKFLSKTTTVQTEDVYVWSWWDWEKGALPNEPYKVNVEVKGLGSFASCFEKWSGMTDHDGCLFFSLTPFLDYSQNRSARDELKLTVTCELLGEELTVMLPKKLFEHYQSIVKERVSAVK